MSLSVVGIRSVGGVSLRDAWPKTEAPGLGQRTLYQRPIRQIASNSLRLVYPYGREDPLRKAEKGDRSVAEVAESYGKALLVM